MLKLSRYLRRYAAFFLVAVVLLAGQATMELGLPNMMSDIVNTGIQRGGITEISPRAVSENTLNFLLMLVPDEDQQTILAAYTPFSALSAQQQEDALARFPEAKALNAYFPAEDADTAETDTAFLHAANGLSLLVQAIAEQTGQGTEFSSSDTTSAQFDMSMLENLDPGLITPQLLAGIKEEAATGVELLMTSVAAVMNKAFYQELGADTDKIQTDYILETGTQMLLLSLLIAICAVGGGFCFARAGAGVARDLRRDMFGKVMGFAPADMTGFSGSSLITRSTNDITQVQMMYSMALRMMIYAPIMGIGGVVMALQKSSGMSWLIALAVLFIICVMAAFIAVVMPKFKRMQKLLDRLNMVSRESLTGLMVVRAFGTESFHEERFDEANKAYAKNNLFTGRAAATLMPLITLVMNGLCLLIVWFGADQVAQSQMQVGDIMAFIQYAMHIVMSFMFIAFIFVMIPRASVSAQRINEVLLRKNKVVDKDKVTRLAGRSGGNIAFNGVSFKYPGADSNVLDNISFTASPGETTAFIGSTGSGKSTLVNLIPRFYDVSQGSITLDGVDVRNLSQEQLRENIAYIPQKGQLFSGTIADNLRYGRENASGEELEKAAGIAQSLDFIRAKDNGFEAEVAQGGGNFSGGQRQRLSIARAIVKNAPIYIFDDSFSALDFATDARLRAALKPGTKNAAVLIVAQRVSTIMHAEQIIVLDHGKIVGKGTHADLLKNCQTYREIAESQLSPEELAAHDTSPKGGEGA